ncbi:MAG: response regulator [Proteobacteria bacterium]|nr:response regulator [Pseudomonadota bacterium]MBI3496242.1 response regulator [Pseudomonadota bacterium]
MRSLIRTILKALGVGTVIEATEGGHALEKLEANDIDLVITDWNMQPVDGLQLARHIRMAPASHDPYVPIIMITGHTDKERVIAARDAGINDFMVKPVSAQQLFSRLTALIESPRHFVRTKEYFGPDRRRRTLPFEGPDRRKPEAEGGEAAKDDEDT